MSNPIYSFVSQLGVDSANPVTKRFDFKSCDLGVNEEVIDTSGNRGTRGRGIERVRNGLRRVAGGMQLQPTALEWSYLLPWMLGAAAVGNVFSLADTLPYRYVTVDKSNGTDGKVFTYDHCLISKATIKATQGQPLDLEMDVVGVDEATGNAGTFPALTLDTTTGPFTFLDLAYVIGGTTVKAKDIEISIDNKIDADRFFNSATLSTAFNALDRHILCRSTLPYGDFTAIYNSGIGGVAATATFTNGSFSLLFSFAALVFPRQPLRVPERQEVMLPIQGQAFSSGATPEVVVTLVS